MKLDEHYNVKLKGFQLAVSATESSPSVSKFIPHFTPPETLTSGTCSMSTDVYRFGTFWKDDSMKLKSCEGMLLWDMANCCQHYPFGQNEPLAAVVKLITSGMIPISP